MEDNANRQYDLFVSYASDDRGWVEGYLLKRLQKAGICYITEAAFELGRPRLVEFERAIKQSHRVLLIVSPYFLADGYQNFIDILAQHYALESGEWRVIPLFLRPVVDEQVPLRLKVLTRINATSPAEWPNAVKKVCSIFQFPLPEDEQIPDCPYPGMQPFDFSKSSVFFGRDREKEEILQKLRYNPFLVIIGNSGSGKSSLVRAGLWPAISDKKYQALFGSKDWVKKYVRPGENPKEALERQLADIGGVALGSLRDKLEARQLLLFIDQFEEVFSAKQGGESFQNTLQELSRLENCSIVLTARADFYPQMMRCSLWPFIKQYRYELLPLDTAGMREAIIKPAETTGIAIQEALVERLIGDAGGQPNALPFLQETLVLLWPSLQESYLPLFPYEMLGRNGRPGLEVAIQMRADAALSKLTVEQGPTAEAIARRIFLRLMQFGEGRPNIRRQQSVSQLRDSNDDPSLFDRVLQHLVDSRLLTLSSDEPLENKSDGDENPPEPKVDIAHEALITGWPTFGKWVEDRGDKEQIRRRLEMYVANWERLGKKVDAGLLDEVELREAVNWQNSLDAKDLGDPPGLDNLIRLSQEAIEKAKQERIAREEREKEHLRMLAAKEQARREEAEARAQERTVAAARLRSRAIALGVAAVVAVLGASIAYVQREEAKKQENLAKQEQKRAERQSNLAFANQLVAQAELVRNQAPNQLPQSVLLATEAVQRFQAENVLSAAAASTLHRGLALLPKPIAPITVSPEVAGTWGGVTFSADRRYIIAAKGNNACVWEVEEGKPKTDTPFRCISHAQKVFALAFDPQRPEMAVASDKEVWVWDVSGNEKAHRSFPTRVFALAYSPDGQHIASGGGLRIVAGDGQEERIYEAVIWDIKTGQEVQRFPHRKEVLAMTYSLDGQRLVTASGQDVVLWDVSSGQVVHRLPRDGRVNAVAYSGKGEYLATGSEDGTARVFRTSDYSEVKRVVHRNATASTITATLDTFQSGPVKAVALDDEGKYMATGSTDLTARVWEVASGRELARIVHGASVSGVVLSGDGKRVVSVADDDKANTAWVWEVSPSVELARLLHESSVLTVAYSPDGKQLLTTTGDNQVRVWDVSVQSPQPPTPSPLTLPGVVAGVTYSADGQWVAITYEGTTARIVKLEDGAEVFSTLPQDKNLTTASMSADGGILATVDEDNIVRVWDIQSREDIGQFPQQKSVAVLALSAVGQFLAIATDKDNIVQVWNTTTKEIVQHVRAWDPQSSKAVGEISQQKSVTALAFNVDGQLLAIATDEDNVVQVWNTVTNAVVHRLQHSGYIPSIAYSRDGKFLAVGDNSRSAWVWDTKKGEAIVRIAHEEDVNGAAFSPDNQYVATASTDQLARIWRWQPDELVKEACARLQPYLEQKQETLFIEGLAPCRER